MLIANLKELKKIDINLIDEDNVKFYDNLMKNKGKILSLDYTGYINFLCDVGVFYVLKD